MRMSWGRKTSVLKRQNIPRDQGVDSSPSPISVKLSHSAGAVFPTPPAVPQHAMALPT